MVDEQEQIQEQETHPASIPLYLYRIRDRTVPIAGQREGVVATGPAKEAKSNGHFFN